MWTWLYQYSSILLVCRSASQLSFGEMRHNPQWILFLILPCVLVTSRPTHDQHIDATRAGVVSPVYEYNAQDMPKQDDSDPHEEQVISVRITSSVAVGRGNGKLSRIVENKQYAATETHSTKPDTTTTTFETITKKVIEVTENVAENIPPYLEGANIEFIKQLNSRKEVRGLDRSENVYSFPSNIRNEYLNETDDSVADASVKSVLEIGSSAYEENDENSENIPLARSVPQSPSPKNYIQGLHETQSERENNHRLTTVSFSIVHDTPKATNKFNEPTASYAHTSRTLADPPEFFNQPAKFYNEPSKVYSQPAQVYSEPAKFYSVPAKIYSEPAKIYSEPAKIYSEPAKIYSEPAKFYSQPASLHLTQNVSPNNTPWLQHSRSPSIDNTINTTPITRITIPSIAPNTQNIEQQPERNYEVDEKISVLTDGRRHGVQESSTESCKQENCKVGYVVEGRQYRKYRVEERTSDGFIVGEYGVVRNEDGALRGVRYTADSDASPRLIYDALMKFLQLK